MALTVAVTKKWQNSDASAYECVGTIAFDSSYPTGGEALDIGSASEVILHVQAGPKSGYVFEFDYANQKLLAYYADNNNASDGALIQVPDTTDLSAVTGVRFRALFS
jgi:hypothetical protein